MKRSIIKKAGIALLVIFIVIQFIPTLKNTGNAAGPDDISTVTHIPGEVQQILNNSCYDCHSNKTTYPWYSRIQPVGLWLNHHIDEGKHKLNFSEFAAYKLKRQLHKLDEVVETIGEQEMPLESYTLIHKTAVLNEEQKRIVISWARQSRLQLEDTIR
ncbi:MAG: heme-binding domain-containing protein [Bacteroidota bacterium]